MSNEVKIQDNLNKSCSIPECPNKFHAKSNNISYCSKHYSRVKRYNDPNYVSPTHRPDCHKITLKEALEKHIKLNTDTGCWLWQSTLNHKGYGQMVHINKRYYTHRASYMLFKGEIPAGMHVLHRCDVRNCCNPSHLFLGTNKDNIQDMVNKNRQAKGEKSGRTSFINDDVETIKWLLGLQASISGIARFYNVNHKTIRQIRDNKTWRHVK